MTIAADWDVRPQTKQNRNHSCMAMFSFTGFRLQNRSNLGLIVTKSVRGFEPSMIPGILGEIFPILKKNPNLQKKMFFFGRLGFSFSHHTPKLQGDNLLMHLSSPSIFGWPKYV